jgi:transcriptional regulator with XRE-family HTH domain
MSVLNYQSRELFSFLVGQRIRYSREQLGISQEQLAKGIVGQSALSLLETGRQFPSSEVLRLIAERLSDPLLIEYSVALEDPLTIHVENMLIADQDLLRNALERHRGKWKDVHRNIALQLCDTYYVSNQLDLLEKTVNLLMNHITEENAQYCVALYYFGSLLVRKGRFTEAESVLCMAEDRLRSQDELLAGKLYYTLGYLYVSQDQDGLAMWYAKLSCDKFQEILDYIKFAKSLALLGTVQDRLGKLDQARDSFLKSRNLLMTWDPNDKDLARIYLGLADVEEGRNYLDEALQWAESALNLAFESEDWVVVSAASRIMCRCHLSFGNQTESTEALSQALESAEHSRDPWSIAWSYLLASGMSSKKEEQICFARKACDAFLPDSNSLLRALALDVLANLMNEESYYVDALEGYRQYIAREIFLSKSLQHLRVTLKSKDFVE